MLEVAREPIAQDQEEITTMYVGLDIGGTKLLVASVDESGRTISRRQRPTPLALGTGLDALHEMIREVSQGRKIRAIGASIGGPLDWQTGVVSPLHQPEWRDVPLKTIMEDQWKAPLAVDVDTNAAVLGEYCFGSERSSRLLYVTVSTGMGGGFLIDGRLYRGVNGSHPEIAHQSIPFRCRHPERVRCECGAPDCLEALVSGNGIRRVYGKPAEDLAEPEWAEVSHNLGQGLRNAAVLYGPESIVLGGGVAMGRGQQLVDAVTDVLRNHLTLVPVPKVRLSQLGYDTALMGAIALAQQALGAVNSIGNPEPDPR